MWKALVFETCMTLGNLQSKSHFNRYEVLLLRLENIKTNQIGKFCQGDIKSTKKLPELLFLYPFTTCLPCVPQSSINILSIINTDNSQMSLFNHSKTLRARDLKFWQHYHHTLCVMCPVSHVNDTCHFFFTKGGKLVCWGSVINGVYPV